MRMQLAAVGFHQLAEGALVAPARRVQQPLLEGEGAGGRGHQRAD
jgi:hypothetical protein